MRAFPVRLTLVFSAFLLGFLPTACRKPQVTAAASPGPLSAARVSLAPAPPAADTATHFTREVRRGERFQQSVAPDMVFMLEPYAGNDSGWTIRLVPGTDTKAMSMDCIGAVSEPLHGSNNLSIEPPDDLSEKVVTWKPRDFEFAPDASTCKQAWSLMNLVYYPSKLTDEQRAEAGERLGKIPTAHGKFTVLSSVLQPSANAGAGENGSIEWLKFEVELNFPAASPN